MHCKFVLMHLYDFWNLLFLFKMKLEKDTVHVIHYLRFEIFNLIEVVSGKSVL